MQPGVDWDARKAQKLTFHRILVTASSKPGLSLLLKPLNTGHSSVQGHFCHLSNEKAGTLMPWIKWLFCIWPPNPGLYLTGEFSPAPSPSIMWWAYLCRMAAIKPSRWLLPPIGYVKCLGCLEKALYIFNIHPFSHPLIYFQGQPSQQGQPSKALLGRPHKKETWWSFHFLHNGSSFGALGRCLFCL